MNNSERFALLIYALLILLICRQLWNEHQHLLDQLRELKDENGRLFKLLSEKDFEMKHLRRQIEEERLALAGTKSSDFH